MTARSVRREELLQAADTVVQREGVSASMAAMAAEAGVTKPILYRHFGDKGGLYAALAERHTERLLAVLTAALGQGATPQDRVRRTVAAYLSTLESDPQVYRFLMQSEEAGTVRGQVRSFLQRLQQQLQAGIAAELGLGPDDPQAGVWAAGIVGMVQSAGDWWLDAPPDRRLSRDDLAENLTQLLWGAYAGAPREGGRRVVRHTAVS